MKRVIYFFVAAIMAIFMVACAPNTMTKGYNKMEEKGYAVQKLTYADLESYFDEYSNIEGKAGIACWGDPSELLIAIWFEDAKRAELFYGLFDIKSEAEQRALFGFASFDIKLHYDHSGKVFYYGTEQACKDFAGAFGAI